MKTRLLFCLFGVACIFPLVGCGVPATTAAEPVAVSGTVNLPDGKPAKDLLVRFFPSSSGTFPGTAETDAAGKFTTKLVPGNYTYAIEATAKAPSAIKSVPPGYLQNDSNHLVEVKVGQSLELKMQ